METRKDYNDKLVSLSKRLGKWPGLKKKALNILSNEKEGYNSTNCREEHRKALKDYEKLKPIREEVKRLKEERDQKFPTQAKTQKPDFLKVTKNMGSSLIVEIEGKQFEINKIHLEGFKRVVYQIPSVLGKNLTRFGIDRTGQDFNQKNYSRSGFYAEVQTGQFQRRR